MKAVIVIASLLLLSCGGTPTGEAARTTARLRTIVLADSAGRDTVDLGLIHEGEIVRQELLLRNGGTVPMVILSVAASCGCTTVDFEKKPVQPGKDAAFSFEYNSRGFTGYQLKQITLRTSLTSQPYTLVVTGDVVK